jgi:WD40 repeat protein
MPDRESRAKEKELQSEEPKYWAFISYSHIDEPWAQWLHRALETYRVPKRIVGGDARLAARRIFPVFRDREELPGSADLGGTIRGALQQSRFLIVICSPQAARSRWVNEEVRHFQNLGRAERTLALITSGEPHEGEGQDFCNTEEECFPSALKFAPATNGGRTGERVEPLAVDVRPGKDHKEDAKLKLIAAILGVDFDQLKRRERIRRRRFICLATVSILLVLICGMSIFEYQDFRAKQRLAEEREEQKTQQLVATAEQALLHGNDLNALSCLKEVPVRFRGSMSVPLLAGFVLRNLAGLQEVLDEPNDSIRRLVIDPSGTTMATVSMAGVVRLVNLDTGAAIYSFGSDPASRTKCIASTFCADGSNFLYLDEHGGTLHRLADASEVRFPFDPKRQVVVSGVFDLKETTFATSNLFQDAMDATSTMTRVVLWDPKSGRPAKEQSLSGIYYLLFLDVSRARVVAIGGEISATNNYTLTRSLVSVDLDTGRIVSKIPVDDMGSYDVQRIDPTGRFAIIGTGRPPVVYDIETGKQAFQLVNSTIAAGRAQWIGSGNLIQSVDRGGTVTIWDGKSGLAVRTFRPPDASAVSVSRSGHYLATVSRRGEIDVWDMASGELIRRFQDRSGWEHPIDPTISDECFQFSNDDRFLISAAGTSRLTKIWDWQGTDPSVLDLPQHEGSANAGYFTSDGSRAITVGDDGYVRISDVGTGRPVRQLRDPAAPAKESIRSAALSPDNSRILAGSVFGDARLWDLTKGTLLKTFRIDIPGVAIGDRVGISADGSLYLTLSGIGRGVVWNSNTLGPVVNFALPQPARVQSAVLSNDGKRILVGTDSGKVWAFDERTGRPQFSVEAGGGSIVSIDSSNVGGKFVAADAGRKVILYGVDGKALFHLEDRGALVNEIHFSPDENSIFAACSDDRVRLWDAGSGALLLELGEDKIEAEDIMGAFSTIPPLSPGETVKNGFLCADLSSDAHLIAGATLEGRICVWNSRDGRQLIRFDGFIGVPGRVSSITFNPSGTRLMATCEGGSCKIWDLTPSSISELNRRLGKFSVK